MILVYSDESGINYKLEKDFFNDGPFIIRGGICVNENKYFHLERMFVELIEDYFKITDWLSQEIHASNIWNLEGYFAKFDKGHIKNFFEELVQLVTKLKIHYVCGVRKKTKNADSDLQIIEINKANFSFLHGVEYYLSTSNETGIIIADIVKEDDNKEPAKNMLDRLLFERMQWRINPKIDPQFAIKSRFKFESRSCCLLDQIHYVKSNNSIFIQALDILNYIIMRVFTYEYLRVVPGSVKPELDKVPVTIDTLHFFIQENASIVNYDDADQDVYFQPTLSLAADKSFLHSGLIKILNK